MKQNQLANKFGWRKKGTTKFIFGKLKNKYPIKVVHVKKNVINLEDQLKN
jgi:hypothetical protein